MKATKLIGTGPISPLHPCFPVKTVLDGIQFHSAASFLIALSIEDPTSQLVACNQPPEVALKLVNRATGAMTGSKTAKSVYWRGLKIPKNSINYDVLLDRMFVQLLQITSIKKSLEVAHESDLTLHPRAMRLIGQQINRDEYSRRLKGIKAGARNYATA